MAVALDFRTAGPSKHQTPSLPSTESPRLPKFYVHCPPAYIPFCRRESNMAGDVQRIAQLLEASLNQAQHKQGEIPMFTPRPETRYL
jgi:hypothetical protein